MLECNLIKEHRPKYNTMLKDDKTYPYIKVTVGEDYPRVLFSRTYEEGQEPIYFGPYTSAGAVKDTIELIQKIYPSADLQSGASPRTIGKDRTLPELPHQAVRGALHRDIFPRKSTRKTWSRRWIS